MLENQKNKIGIIHEYLTYLFFFLVPMQDSVLPWTLGIWVVSWLLWRVLHIKNSFPVPSKATKIGIILFLLFVIYNYASAFWGVDPSLGGPIMERRLSFLIFPVVMLLGYYPQLDRRKLIKAFLYGNLCAIAIFSIQFIIAFYTKDGVKYQIDIVGLKDYIDAYKHPAYMSVNLVIAFFLYLTELSHSHKSGLINSVLIYVMSALFIYFSSSRAGVLNLLLLTFGIVFYISKSQIGIKKSLIIAIPLLMVFGYGIVSSHKFQKIFDNSEYVAVRAPRKILWKSAVEKIGEKPLFGYGIGSSKLEFVEQCKNNGIYYAEERHFNAHNQYLEYLLESGLLGLLLLFFSIFYMLKGIENKKRWIGIVIVFLLGFALFFESMLLRIAGISTMVIMMLFLVVMSGTDTLSKKENETWIGQTITSITVLLFLSVLLLLWRSSTLQFDANNPVTYAYKDYILVENADLPQPLPGELLNNQTDAAQYDKNSQASIWSENAYLINEVESKILKEGEQLLFSAYCYVSPDFDGEWVRISIEEEGQPAMVADCYNLKKKGTWQKLEVKIDDKTGLMPAYFFFCRKNCNSFKDLKGYVIYAYPQYIISEK